MRDKLENSGGSTKTSLKDVISIEGDLYIVTNLEPLELTAIEHYDTRGNN